jgi:glycosyltransferase involved in cell wall biosynthesis
MVERHVLYVQPNSEVGGSDIALARTIEAMATTGQRSSVILPVNGPLVARMRKAGAEVYFLPMKQLRTLPSVTYQGAYLARFIPTVLRLRRKIRQIDPDLVHTNSAYCLYGALAAKLAGVPHVWHIREMVPQLPVLTAAYAGMIHALSTIVLAMSDAALEALYSRSPKGAMVMPDSLDANAFRAELHPGRLRRDLDIPKDRPIVGFAARLDPWKGADVFINAVAEVARSHPKPVFVIAGGSPEGLEFHLKELRAQVKRLNLEDRVQFLGWRYQLGDIADVMDGFDIFCHTSIVAEPFGLVLLEAMSVGTPVIAARAGGPLTIIEDGVSGFLTEPGNAKALAAAIQKLLDDPARASALGAAGKIRQLSEFSVPIFIDRLSAVYDEAMRT